MQESSDAGQALDPATLGRQLFEASPDCVKLLDHEGRIVAMNRCGLRVFGVDDIEAVRGRSWKSFCPPACHPDLEAALATARDGGVGRFRGCMPDAAGALTWWDVTISAIGAGLLATSRNITGQVAAEAERERLVAQLRAANERMEDVFRQAPAFMCVFSGPDLVFEMENERYLQLVGGRSAIGLPLRRALPEIAGQGFIERLEGVYRSGEPVVGNDVPVMLQRRADGPLERCFVDQVYMPLRDPDGRVTGILVHGIDVTDRKLAEIELFESRERFQKIVSQAATGVVQMDTEARIVLVNQKYCDMVGRSEAELAGASVLDVTAPDSVPVTADALRRLAAGENGVVIDKEYLRPDGTLMPATSSVNALRGPAGEFQGLVAIVVDTTEKRAAEERLRASEERYRTLFESVDQGFCILEMIFDEGDRPVDYRFLEMNAMFEAHTGLVGGAGKTAREMVPDLDSFWFETYGRVAQTGEAVRFESEAAAMERWFDVYATRLGGADSRRVALLFSDITKRKESEATLRKLANDLAEADRRKTEFLATLAHELRNPLAPIRSGLSVMRLKGDSPASVARVREMMERQVGYMVHLIDDLLDIARISGGKLELKRERADLRAVLSSAVETSLPLIETGRHALTVDLPDAEVPAEVDTTRIAQVVANLLNNVAKYTPAGGRLGLSLRVEEHEAVIAVSDNGIGIPPDELSSVFDMFSQVGLHTDRSQGGLGIGLSLVRRLVTMHGGAACATSAGPGAGSTFTVRLPLAAGAGAAGRGAAASNGDGADGEGMKILVVDDNVDAAVTLSMILEACGYSAQVAHDGARAVELAAAFRPQVAFLDIGMPGMDGYDTARAMRQVAGLENLTLVALTGWGADSDRQKSSAAGFDHHLTKPVQLDVVQELLARLAA
ncbi:MAG: PAS domain-containing protein [Janthinobacterium lividum]